MLSMITAALQGLAALPKLIDAFEKFFIELPKLMKMEQKLNELHDAVGKLSEAKTQEELKAAAKAISKATNG